MKVTLSKRLELNKIHFKLMFTPVAALQSPYCKIMTMEIDEKLQY